MAKKKAAKKTAAKSTGASGNDTLKSDVYFIVAICIIAIICLSNFGIVGIVGIGIKWFFFAIMGVVEYVFPFVVGFHLIYRVAKKKIEKRVQIKFITAYAMLAIIAGIVQRIYEKPPVSFDNMWNFFVYSGNDSAGGGIIGGFLACILSPTGYVGTLIILFGLLVIGVIIITGWSVKKSVSDASEKVSDAKEGYKRKKQERELEELRAKEANAAADEAMQKNAGDSGDADTAKEEKNLTRSNNKKYGVGDTTLGRKATATAAVAAATVPATAMMTDPDGNYNFPPLSLLRVAQSEKRDQSSSENQRKAQVLKDVLKDFGVNVNITDISCGPAVTRFEVQPESGVKVSKIVSLADDIKLNMAAEDIRIEAPIPGKAAVGIEVPNESPSGVSLGEIINTNEFREAGSLVSFAVGEDIAGKPVMADIAKMPHLLIAGATGSGKSVCINSLIVSILYKAKPDQVKMIMIDPKVVELSVYNGIPHLLIPVVTDPKKAVGALNWAVAEMDGRYKKFAKVGAKNLKDYNAKVKALNDGENEPIPQLLVIIDELADLMMVAQGDVETAICRLAQLARAAGIHLIIATQRPSVNVITGLIKANIPSRIAFAVSSGVDSRTIIDMNGAEKLLGKGDMLFFPAGIPKPKRMQGAFVSDEEVSNVVNFLKEKNETADNKTEEEVNEVDKSVETFISSPSAHGDGRDELFAEAGRLVIEKERGSIGMLQRNFRIGFNRAARIMDQLTDAGVVGPETGTKPRQILMTDSEFEAFINKTEQ